MERITEQQILSMAPNSTAVANARKISAKGGFVSRSKTEDETFFMGECKGSGKSNYTVSVDFFEEGTPVCRCSCPSRQFPCKHGLALLFEIEQKKEFTLCELPDSIREKREKKEKKAAKAASEGEDKPASKPKKTSKAARVKKMKKQMEGILLLRKLMDSLLASGLGAFTGVSLKSYRDLAKQLGDYYLPGPQVLLNRLIIEGETYQKDGKSVHQEQILQILVRLNTLMKKSEAYLKEKIENDDGEDDDSVLYEELGGIWTLERLKQLGRSRENANLLQLAFYVYLDDARKEWIDKGYYVDFDTGEIVTTCNYCPVKALKYVKREDSIFQKIHIPTLIYYPGNANPRVRWEWAEFEPVTKEMLTAVRGLAEKDLAAVIKKVKNIIKNPLDTEDMAVLCAYRRIGILKEGESLTYVMEDESGNRIALNNRHGEEDTMSVLMQVTDSKLFADQVLLGKMFYDTDKKTMYMQPLCIVTDQKVVRFAY